MDEAKTSKINGSGRPESAGIVLSSPIYRGVTAGALFAMAVACFGGIGTYSDPLSQGAVIGWIVIGSLTILIVRALRTAIVLDGNTIVVRSLLRTRHVEVARIERVRAIGYSGLLNRASQSGFFKMLHFDLNDGELNVPAIVGRSGRMNDLASRINGWLGYASSGRGEESV